MSKFANASVWGASLSRCTQSITVWAALVQSPLTDTLWELVLEIFVLSPVTLDPSPVKPIQAGDGKVICISISNSEVEILVTATENVIYICGGNSNFCRPSGPVCTSLLVR